MNPTRWELIKTVVDKALTLSGGERREYVDSACGEYPSISTDIRELIQCVEEADRENFMKEIRSEQKSFLRDLSDSHSEKYWQEEFINREIGAYRITELLGRGGMGTVFKATRVDGEFHQDAAIKLIHSGRETKETARRFRAEKEILAGLQHPNIAYLLDGGVTSDGISYLIMEYVDGVPVDQYCDEQRLRIEERLRLFREICNTVQYAHNKLIVHRDLKADNILVTNEGSIKILDFGIAKMLQPDPYQPSAVMTLPGQKIWTPQYASPEQVRGEPVSVSSDVYALGVLLNKLLTGAYPYSLDGRSLAEIEEIIKHEEPLIPSQVFKLQDKQGEYAYQRNATVDECVKALKGDLDALVSKAIRKEPEYRYQSVKEISDEIDRYFLGIPLLARDGTYRYRTEKFIRRHKAGLATFVSISLIIIVLVSLFTRKITNERNIAQLERDKLEQVVDFLTGLFEAGDPVASQGANFTATDLLEKGVERAEDLQDQPLLQAEMLSVIGESYRSMNRPDSALPVLKRALEIQRDYYGGDHADIAGTLNALGSVYWSDGMMKDAQPYLNEALNMRRRLYGDIHPDVFTSMNNYALVLLGLGELDEAEKMYLKTLDARRSYYGNNHAKVGVSLNNLAFFLMRRGKFEEAEKYFRETVSLWRNIQGDEHSDVGIALNNLGDLLRKMGRYDEAEQHLRESLEIRKKVYGAGHMKTGYALNNLAMTLKDKQEYEEAMLYGQQSLELFRNFHGADHNNIAIALSIVGLISADMGNIEEAEDYLNQSLSMRLRLYPEDHPEVKTIKGHLANFYNRTQRPELAEKY